MRLSDAEVAAIARLKTVKRSYSQAYWINGTRGRGTIALRVGPTEYGLATSDPVGDLPRRTQLLERRERRRVAHARAARRRGLGGAGVMPAPALQAAGAAVAGRDLLPRALGGRRACAARAC